MTADELSAVVAGITEAVSQEIGHVTETLMKRIAVLESELATQRKGLDGGPGLSAYQVAVTNGFSGSEVEWLESLKGQPGRDATDPVVDLDAIAVKAAELVPKPSDGKDAEVDLKALVDMAMERIPVPVNGKDGASVTVEDLQPTVEMLVAKAVSALPAPKDPAGLVDSLVDRDGHLVLTLSDGRTKNVGRVVGKDGESVNTEAVVAEVKDAIAALPVPENGKDGRDGFGFEDVDFQYDEQGRTVAVYKRGDLERRVRVISITDQGVFREGRQYLKGDGVSYGRGFWIAQDDTTDRPGEGKTAWRLAVKRGEDGRPGPKGDKGDPGKDGSPGRPGHDLR